MGGFLSSLIGWFTGNQSKVGALPEHLGPEADMPNSDSPLTYREVAFLSATWTLVKTDLRAHGIKFFILLFETHPHIQAKFKSFAGKPIADLLDNKTLAAHGTTVMTAIDSYLENLDDLSVVVEMLKITGANHQARGVVKEDFELTYVVLLQYLGEALGPAWSNGALLAWTHLLQVVHSVISLAFDEQ